MPAAPVVCDIGCGRGTTTLQLAARLAPARLIALDQSQALLDTVQDRVGHPGHAVETVCTDFHHLPLPEASINVAVVKQAVPAPAGGPGQPRGTGQDRAEQPHDAVWIHGAQCPPPGAVDHPGAA